MLEKVNIRQKLNARKTEKKQGISGLIVSDFKINYGIYALAIPGILYYLIFCYLPMYGVIIAFKDYSPSLGILGSNFVGLKHFMSFFESIYFSRVVSNTIILNLFLILFSFPAPIILALMINEIKVGKFSKTVQTCTYMPHFISTVVICGMVIDFTSNNGIITNLINSLGGNYENLLYHAELYRAIYVLSDIWQTMGWNSIVYLAAILSIDSELYEAAEIDGANKFAQLMHVTIPGILPTIVIMLVLRIGNIMSVGAEKVILLYNPVIYEVSDVISSFIYRKGLIESNQSFSAAVGMFNSVINCVLVFGANYISKKATNSGLW